MVCVVVLVVLRARLSIIKVEAAGGAIQCVRFVCQDFALVAYLRSITDSMSLETTMVCDSNYAVKPVVQSMDSLESFSLSFQLFMMIIDQSARAQTEQRLHPKLPRHGK